MSEKPRMLWVARYTDGSAWCFREHPINRAGAWNTESPLYSGQHKDAFPDIQPGESRMFIEFAPRVAGDVTSGAYFRWGSGGWNRIPYAMPGDIILPMPPDPTPYLPQADPNAARREEIRAQIAALQAELDGMEG